MTLRVDYPLWPVFWQRRDHNAHFSRRLRPAQPDRFVRQPRFGRSEEAPETDPVIPPSAPQIDPKVAAETIDRLLSAWCASQPLNKKAAASPETLTAQRAFETMANEAIDAGLLRTFSHDEDSTLYQLSDPATDTDLIIFKSPEGKFRLWLDVADMDNPYFQKLNAHFSWAPTAYYQGEDLPQLELPQLDANSLQLTLYCLEADWTDDAVAESPAEAKKHWWQRRGKPSGAPEAPPEETDLTLATEIDTQHLRVFAGSDFLVTVDPVQNPSLVKVKKLLQNNAQAKSPMELLHFLLRDVINRYDVMMDYLNQDFKTMRELVSSDTTEKDDFKKFLSVSGKFDAINNAVRKQERIVKELLELHDFSASPLVDADAFERSLRELEHHEGTLRRFETTQRELIDLYRSKMSNNLDASMKRMTLVGTLFGPATVMSGLMGMNVLIPGSGIPFMFWYVAGGTVAATGGLYALFKKKKWL